MGKNERTEMKNRGRGEEDEGRGGRRGRDSDGCMCDIARVYFLSHTQYFGRRRNRSRRRRRRWVI